MNKRYLSMIAAAAAIILAASCTSDQPELQQQANQVEIRLRADVSNMLLTRAATDIQGSQFGESESINVEIIDAKIDKDGNPTTNPASPVRVPYILNTTDAAGAMSPTGTPPYFPNSGNKVNIYAYYPSTFGTTATSSSYVWSEGYTTFSVAADQTSATGYKASDLMYGVPASNPVARTTSTIPLTFTHCLSKVIVRIKGDGNGVQTSSLSTATVAMKAMTSAPVTNEGVATSQTWASGSATTVSMGTGTATTIETVDYYETAAIVVPQTIAASSASVITITLSGGAVYTYTPSKVLTIEAGKVHIFTITLGLHGISVSATITPWGSGTGDTASLIL